MKTKTTRRFNQQQTRPPARRYSEVEKDAIRQRIFDYLRAAGDHGLTAYELMEKLGAEFPTLESTMLSRSLQGLKRNGYAACTEDRRGMSLEHASSDTSSQRIWKITPRYRDLKAL